MATTNKSMDKLGFSASFFCAIHCALLPVLAGVLPMVGLQFLAEPAFEQTMFVTAFIIASLSLFPSYFRHHRKIQAIVICISGFALIVLGHVITSEWIGLPMIVVGALSIALAHYVNYHECRKCPRCHDGNCCSSHPTTP